MISYKYRDHWVTHMGYHNWRVDVSLQVTLCGGFSYVTEYMKKIRKDLQA